MVTAAAATENRCYARVLPMTHNTNHSNVRQNLNTPSSLSSCLKVATSLSQTGETFLKATM